MQYFFFLKCYYLKRYLLPRAKLGFNTRLIRKLEMCPEDTDAPTSEILDVGNLLYTAQ